MESISKLSNHHEVSHDNTDFWRSSIEAESTRLWANWMFLNVMNEFPE
jgi:hypothetical protein